MESLIHSGPSLRDARQDSRRSRHQTADHTILPFGDGSQIVRNKGVAVFKYGERIGGADVIFGEEGDSMLWALYAGGAWLALDPLKRELRPLPMDPGGPSATTTDCSSSQVVAASCLTCSAVSRRPSQRKQSSRWLPQPIVRD